MSESTDKPAKKAKPARASKPEASPAITTEIITQAFQVPPVPANSKAVDTAAVALSPGLRAVQLERARVINEKGRTEEMDDAYTSGELVQAAACYASLAAGGSGIKARAAWPFDLNTFKPGESTRDLIKAAQFLVAELDRRSRQGDLLLPAAD